MSTFVHYYRHYRHYRRRGMTIAGAARAAWHVTNHGF